MIRYIAAFLAGAVVSIPAVTIANTVHCHGAIRPNADISVNGNGDAGHVVTADYALSASKGPVSWPYFAYAYQTKGAGYYLIDSANRTIAPLTSLDAAGIRKAYALIHETTPTQPISTGADSFLNGAASLDIEPCGTS